MLFRSLTSVIPDFVTLAQKRIVRDIVGKGGHSALEDSTTISFSAASADLPTDFLAVRSVNTNTTVSYRIPVVSYDTLKTAYSTPGNGKACAISGTKIHVSPDVYNNYSAVLNYYKEPVEISVSQATNDLFPVASDAYLYAALIEASIYTKGDPSTWASAYNAAIQNFLNTDRKSKFGSNLSVVAA